MPSKSYWPLFCFIRIYVRSLVYGIMLTKSVHRAFAIEKGQISAILFENDLNHDSINHDLNPKVCDSSTH
jgi:hypothetical protein